MEFYNDYTVVDFLLYCIGPFIIIIAGLALGAVMFKFIDGIGLEEEKKSCKEFKKLLKSNPEIQKEIDEYYKSGIDLDRMYHEADISRYYELYGGGAPREIIEKYTKKNGNKQR